MQKFPLAWRYHFEVSVTDAEFKILCVFLLRVQYCSWTRLSFEFAHICVKLRSILSSRNLFRIASKLLYSSTPLHDLTQLVPLRTIHCCVFIDHNISVSILFYPFHYHVRQWLMPVLRPDRRNILEVREKRMARVLLTSMRRITALCQTPLPATSRRVAQTRQIDR